MSDQSSAPFPHPQAAKLEAHARRHQSLKISELLQNPGRLADFSISAAGLTLDYSRQLLDDQARSSLLALAESAQLGSAREGLYDGRILNQTEQRPVLHTLLRAAASEPGLEAEFALVSNCRARMANWVERVSSGSHLGYNGKTITDVVNLGIGGSDLGPRMVCQALTPYHEENLRVHFCANIDPADLQDTLRDLDPARTLFIICSKTLRTEETLHNAEAARRWLLAQAEEQEAIGKHFLAVSTNLAAALEFGIPEDNILPMWDWVGGRYSLWSAIGWSIAFAAGNAVFDQLLAGAAAMDRHFRESPLAQNMPVMLSLLEIWYVNFMGSSNHAVIPYSHHLRRLPAFLQQLTMESNGKRVNHAGLALGYATAPVLWGEAGSNGQHSFHQLLHQGTLLCPVDFILALTSDSQEPDMHTRLVANCIAQGQALMLGRDEQAALESLLERGMDKQAAKVLAPQLVIPGNRPSSTIGCHSLTPERLGALLALYEHKTFCSGFLWQINSFDQWGVELGKVLSAGVYEALAGSEGSSFDVSTDALIQTARTE